MKEHADKIADCNFTVQTLRSTGMSTRGAEKNAELLAPIEELLKVPRGSLYELLETANDPGNSERDSARLEAHELFKQYGLYYWTRIPGSVPFIGVIEESAPIPEHDANVHIVSLFIDIHERVYGDFNGMTTHEKNILLEPMVFRHAHNKDMHLLTEKLIADPAVNPVTAAEAQAVFTSLGIVHGIPRASEALRPFESNLLVSILRDTGATSFEDIRRVYENDTALHEVQHYHDIDAHYQFDKEPDKGELEYGAYLVNLAQSPIRKYLMATHVRKHFSGEVGSEQGAYTRIVDAYMEALDINNPVFLLDLDAKEIGGVAEELLNEHYGADGYCHKKNYF